MRSGTYMWLKAVLLVLSAMAEQPSPGNIGLLLLEALYTDCPVYQRDVTSFDLLGIGEGLVVVCNIHPVLAVGCDKPFDLSAKPRDCLSCSIRQGGRDVDEDIIGRNANDSTSSTDRQEAHAGEGY